VPAAVRVPVQQGSPEWLDYRRSVVTATDIPVILGLSPYRCEADLADEKLGLAAPQDSTVRMRMGSALEDLNLSEYEALTGCRAVRYRAMVRHPRIEWAAASPDARRIGSKRLIELKFTTSRTRFADGLPQDVEGQARWQMGVSGYPVCDVSVLTPDGLMDPFEVVHDPDAFADLVTIAGDFRRRLAAGGPFSRDEARIRRDHPADDGSEISADADTAEAVRALLDVRAAIARHEETEKALKAAIEARMGDAALMTGPGFRVTWKRGGDRMETDWKALASELVETLPETDRIAVVGRHTAVRPGMRPLRVVSDKED
jgi:putative phage-type endonuclease